MAVIILLLTASISVATIFLVAFLWSVKTKQFEDQYSSAVRILFEPPVPPAKTSITITEENNQNAETDSYAGR
jgi:cbb3-type cytochrome oxidase maturation protein